MKAIGLIETRGITASIIGADAMLKSARVEILEKTIVGGGNVVIVITGDVGAVTAAIEAGESAIKALNSSLFITKNVIARPEKSLENTVLFPITEEKETEEKTKLVKEIKVENIEKNEIKDKQNEKKEKELKEVEKEKELKAKEIKDAEIKETEIENEKEVKKDIVKIEIKKLNNKKDLDEIILENELSEVDDALQKLRVKEIRKLARQYEELGIKSKDIATATKAKLIEGLKTYYEKNEVEDKKEVAKS